MPRSARIRRRTLLSTLSAIPAFGLLSGCGWQPIYGSAAGGVAGPAQTGLAETSVALIPERAGQLLRQALQARFERGAGVVPQRYELSVSRFSISGEAVAIQRDNTTSRMRLVATASWVLASQEQKRRTLTSGTAREVDGYNVIDQQYFAADMENEAVQRRMAEAIADQITQQLAVYFKRQAATG